jgi:hypothetical protein
MNIDGPVTAGLRLIYLSVCHITDEYMGLTMVKPDDPCIRRFEFLTDERKIIFVGFKADEYRWAHNGRPAFHIFIGVSHHR